MRHQMFGQKKVNTYTFTMYIYYTKAKNEISGIETSNVEAFWGSALRNLANNFLWPNQWKVVNEFNKPVIKSCMHRVCDLSV